MKKISIAILWFAILWLGILTAGFIFLTAFHQSSEIIQEDHSLLLNLDDVLRKDAFEILDIKCNVCHRRQNPFMVFNLKNMEKRAPKIYKRVFIERRMPKGNEIRLTNEEYSTLKKWLLTQKIN